MKTFIGLFLVVLAVVGIGFFLFTSSKAPNPADLPGQLFDDLGGEHIADGSKDHPAYNSNPPTSGWHWPAPAEWGVYDPPEADERYIHNLEHGGIWITYKPSTVSAEDQAKLKDFSKRWRKIIVTPREANDSNIALAAWTRLQQLDSYDENTIIRFIEAFYDQGPEKVP
ncbi:MAG: DUF3105 domain-containing protein [Candidatus Doudnabacteria bacterium]|nr:DUF3105 domain-containing protein [Candidatus Doudnabacteria bacterium]